MSETLLTGFVALPEIKIACPDAKGRYSPQLAMRN